MPLSTYKTDFQLHYGSDFKIMKFGVVGIKIWLLLLRQQAPYYYRITFINNI
jgi:ribosomal protein S3